MDIADTFNQTVGWAARSATPTAAGEYQFAAASNIAARVEDKPLTARKGAGGSEADSRAAIYTATQVSVGDRIWLPGKNTSQPAQGREVLRVDSIPDPDGFVDFYMVSLR